MNLEIWMEADCGCVLFCDPTEIENNSYPSRIKKTGECESHPGEYDDFKSQEPLEKYL